MECAKDLQLYFKKRLWQRCFSVNTVLRSFLRTSFLKNMCQRLLLSLPSDLAALRPIRKRGHKVFKVLVLCFFKAFPINFQLIRLFNFFHCWNRLTSAENFLGTKAITWRHSIKNQALSFSRIKFLPII